MIVLHQQQLGEMGCMISALCSKRTGDVVDFLLSTLLIMLCSWYQGEALLFLQMVWKRCAIRQLLGEALAYADASVLLASSEEKLEVSSLRIVPALHTLHSCSLDTDGAARPIG